METREHVIIIGTMKSGTTTLFDILARHPRIAPASEKEPGFFAFDGVFAKGFDWYEGLFGFDPDRHRYRLEASTDYTKTPFVTGVWERMTADPAVRVKLICILRHPLARIESHARFVQTTGKEIGQRLSRKADHALDAGLSPVNLAISAYATQLDAFAEADRAGDLHVLTLDDLTADPAAALAEIARFLDLDPAGFGVDAPASNQAGSKRRATPAWDALARLRPVMALGRALLPGRVRTRIRQAFQRPVVAEGRFTLDPAERTALARLLAPEMARLEAERGVPVRALWPMPDDAPRAGPPADR